MTSFGLLVMRMFSLLAVVAERVQLKLPLRRVWPSAMANL